MCKKVLRVCHKFMKDNDGYDITIREMSDILSKHFEQHIVFFETEEFNKVNLKEKLKFAFGKIPNNIHLHPITYKSKGGKYTHDLFDDENRKKFRKEFEKIFYKINPDVLHIHGTLAPPFKFAGKLAKKENKKVIATHHGGMINQHKGKVSKKIKKFLLHNSFPFICDKIICLSEHGRNSFIYKRNAEIIFGIKPPSSKKKIRSNKEYRFVYPARFSPNKNQKILVEVWSELIKECPRLKLDLFGRVSNSVYFLDLKKFILDRGLKKNVSLSEEINHKDSLRKIENSDFLISSSLNEGRSRACMEALCLETPIIVSDNSGQRENIQTGQEGLTFDPRKKESIKESVREAIKKIGDFEIPSQDKFNERYINKLFKIYS